MKAAYIEAYGTMDKVQIGDQPKPELAAGQALIRLKAASVNPIDWKIVKGDLKPLFSLPLPLLLGSDGAGIIEQIGAGVSDYKIGDAVFFRCNKTDTGTYAQYIAVVADLIAPIPSNMSFEEAASIPLVGFTASQALVEKGGMRAGSQVLIHAGAGGVGTFAIQYAKAHGAYVATTASKKRFQLLKALGADEIIDYRSEKFEDRLSDFDIVLDSLGSTVHEASYKVLKKGGVLVTILGIPDPDTVAEITSNPIIKLVARLSRWNNRRKAAKHGAIYKHHWMVSNGAQLKEIAALIEAGKIRAVIDRTYPLDQVQQAFEYSQTGRAEGKIIITID